MAYTKQLWANGDIITAAKMNHMEDGIDAISANGAIGTSNLANASVTNAKLDQGAVDTSNIANGAVGTTEIQDGAVTSAKLADSAYHNTAATFDTTKAYSSGDYCVYNGALYRFTADKAAGAWDSTKVVTVALADDVDEVKSEIQKINAVTLYNGTMTNGSVSKTTGENLSSSSLVRTSWVDVSNIEKLIYSRIYTTSSSASWGMAFYSSKSVSSFLSGEGPVLNADTFHAELSELAVPEGANYARFTWGRSAGDFVVYDKTQYDNAILTKHGNDIETLKTATASTEKEINGLSDDLTTRFVFIDSKRIKPSNGAYQSGSYKATHAYVNIEKYNQLKITMLAFENATDNGIAFYSSASESAYIDGYSNVIAPTRTGVETVIDIPSGAKYVRTTYFMDADIPEGAPAFNCVGVYEGLDERITELEETTEGLISNGVYNMRSQEHFAIIEDMQSGHGFTNPLGSGSEPTDDTTDYLFGSQSVRFNSAGQKQISANGIDLSNKIINVKLKVNTITTGDEVRLYLSNTASLTSYVVFVLYEKTASDQFKTGEWADVTVSTNGGRSVGTPDITKIKYLRLAGNNSSVDYNVQSIGFRETGDQKPCISFTFDDGWAEVIDGAKILGKYGIPATAYIFEGCQLTTEQLKTLRFDYGWDIEMHGANVFTNKTEEELVAELTSLQNYIVSNGLGRGEHMAYPGGQNNRTVVDIVSRFCKTGRTISNENSKTETIPTPMPYNLRAVSAIGSSGVSVANVKKYIDYAVKRKGWLILVFHRIGDTLTSMFCSAEELAEIAEYAINSGADIKTVSDMWERN